MSRRASIRFVGSILARNRGAVLVAVCVAAGGCGGGGSTSKPSAGRAGATRGHGAPGGGARPKPRLGAFAGYAELSAAPITELSAVLTVPRIARDSRAGFAGTWIGASAPGGAPFIQLGVNEERRAARGRDRSRYYAFWSDTAHGYHPVSLLKVRAADRVRVMLTLTAGHWTLDLNDSTAHTHRRLTTSQDADTGFSQAQFFQEDPSRSPGGPEPYPTLSDARFENLTVDQQPLHYQRIYSSWMSTNGTYLAPTDLYNDSFGLHVVHPGPTRVRYLQIIQNVYDAINAYGAIVTGHASTTQAQRSRAGTQLAARLAAPITQLYRGKWPADVSPMLGILASNLQALLRATHTVSTTSSKRLPWAVAAWNSEVSEITGDNAAAATSLKLPEFPPAG